MILTAHCGYCNSSIVDTKPNFCPQCGRNLRVVLPTTTQALEQFVAELLRRIEKLEAFIRAMRDLP